jgi:hypothetical protein
MATGSRPGAVVGEGRITGVLPHAPLGGVPSFVEVDAPRDDELHSLL